MSFENTERIAAIAPELVGMIFPQLLAQFGEPLADGDREILTIGAHWDDTAKTRKRAASLTDGTIAGIPLTDGRVAFRCLWQSDLTAVWEAGQLTDVEQLTEEQFQSAQPQEEEE